MDMKEYEFKYWELREDEERAFDRYIGAPNEYNRNEWLTAKEIFGNFCMDILAELMENNSDVLERLKNE